MMVELVDTRVTVEVEGSEITYFQTDYNPKWVVYSAGNGRRVKAFVRGRFGSYQEATIELSVVVPWNTMSTVQLKSVDKRNGVLVDNQRGGIFSEKEKEAFRAAIIRALSADGGDTLVLSLDDASAEIANRS